MSGLRYYCDISKAVTDLWDKAHRVAGIFNVKRKMEFCDEHHTAISAIGLILRCRKDGG